MNILVLAVFILSAFKIRPGFYLFIFFVPLLNTLTTILEVSPIAIILYLFFAFFLGFILNYFEKDYKNKLELIGPKSFFDNEIAKSIIFFIIIFSISAVVAVIRYTNFFPFITNHYHNLAVNIKTLDSTSASFIVIRTFFDYFAGFALLAAVFNIMQRLKDIILALLVLVFSTVISMGVVFYQHFINPYLGTFKYWVDSGRLNATFSDPNSLGAYCILLFPIFLVLIIFFKKWYVKLIFGLLMIPFLFMVFFSGSRSALLAIIFSLIIFIVIAAGKLINYIRKFPKKKKVITIIVIVVIIVIIITALLGIFLTKNQVKLKILNIGLIQRIVGTITTFQNYYKSSGFLESLKSISNFRYIYWNQAIHMAKDHPLSGVGLGTYTIEVPDYLYKYEPGFVQVDYTGNYYLQILSELGFPGLILIIFIFYLFINRVFRYFGKQKKLQRKDNSNWLLTGLFISFMTMLIAQFFGPHTNFSEVQYTFWLIIGLIFAFIKVKENQEYQEELKNTEIYKTAVLKPDDRVSLYLRQKISLAVVIALFTAGMIAGSISNLSIAAKQDNCYWSNNYGFYKPEVISGQKFQWTASDASEVLEKKGSAIIIPIQDANPVKQKTANTVRIYIDNLLVKTVKLKDNSWYNLDIKLPSFTVNRFTLTIVVGRNWVPKELGLNNDTRELGVRIGEIEFIK
ncbi:MAG: O-antigen ligase family protein [Cyanobacteria bacterium]|nr:O-antigen ligase family protein [Cyanobacteriota bacterium]